MTGSAKTNMILQPSDWQVLDPNDQPIHRMVESAYGWMCDVCSFETKDLSRVAKHVVEKQFKVRDRGMDFSIFS